MKKLIAMLALSLMILTACAGENAPPADDVQQAIPDVPVEYVYTKETVDYTEKNKQYSFRMDMERTDTEKAHYFFEKKIVDEQRRACIEATEQILAQLGELPAIPEICVLTEKSYGSLFVVGNRLFLTEQDWQTHEYVTNVLMAVYGDFTHFGLAYGYANLLCQRLNWGEPAEGAFVVPSVVEVCDLGLLCFDTAFVSEDDANTAKNLACHFSAGCEEETLKRLISESDTTEGMAAVRDALAEYYAANGVTYEPSMIRYGFGGISYDYIVESDIGTFYLCDEWQDRYYQDNPMVSENFLHENYAELNEFFEINLMQMQQYRDTINLYPYDDDISIIMTDDPYLHVSYCNIITNQIYMISVVSMMHEYIHALTKTENIEVEAWQIEGFARYFDLRYDHYGAPHTTWDYTNNMPDNAVWLAAGEYVAALDRPLDMVVDCLTIFDLICYCGGATDPNQGDGYIAGASFINYLAKQYGEQTVIQSIYGGGEPLPKPHGELVADWVAYLNETYKDYSKLEK